MDSYRFIVANIANSNNTGWVAGHIPREVPEQEIVELRAGDKFYFPDFSALYYIVMYIDLQMGFIRYCVEGLENDFTYSMQLSDFADKYSRGGAINRNGENIYSRNIPNTVNEPVPPRTVNIADEEDYWSPDPEDMPAPTYPDPFPIEEESYVQNAARILRNNNTWRNILTEYGEVAGSPVEAGTTIRPSFPEGELRYVNSDNNISEIAEYVNECLGVIKQAAKEEEPIELSEEVWVF